MKTKFLLLAAICMLSIAGVSAQQKVTSLKITTTAVDSFSFEGGVFTILNDAINVTYASNSSLNKSYSFADVVSIAFETSGATAIKQLNADRNPLAYVDGSGILQVNSTASPIEIFSVTGAKIASFANAGSTQLDLSAYPNGIFLVKAGNQTVKVIK